MPEIETLGDALPKEIERVEGLIKLYEEVPMGYIAAGMMGQDVKHAKVAIIEGDLPTMITIYKQLKEYHE